MRVLLVGPSTSAHLQQWTRVLTDAGIDVEVATLHPSDRIDVAQHVLRPSAPAGYVLGGWSLRRAIARARPDVVHVHYLTGYGTLGRTVRSVPVVASAWGSDVMHFPTRTPLHRWLVRGNVARSMRVCVTSRAMVPAVEALGVGASRLRLTPFGVDVDRFRPVQRDGSPADEIVIGTVKTLDPIYGIDILIDAFAAARQMVDESTAVRLRLRIVGDGPSRRDLEDRVSRLGLDGLVTFVGAIPHAEVPAALAGLDVFVALSRRESFGVAVLEASAAGLPVVVASVGGLPEVVDAGVTGVVVPPEDPERAARAIVSLVTDHERRAAFGRAGRSFVQERYSWPVCASTMIAIYEDARRSFTGVR